MKCGHRIWHRIVRTVPALGFLGIGLFAFEVQAQFGPPPLPIIETLDKNGDGQIDQDELANAVASLKALDNDGDGQLTPQELLPDMPFGGPGFGGPGGGRGFGGPGGFGGDERAVLEEYDADKSGWLNKAERAEARKSLASDGGGRGGRRGPGGGRFGGGEPQPGRKVSPDQVAQFPEADLYDTSVLRTI
ncbi:MAG: hypothetical protein KDA87_16985, partial [Planctomycetales bacterium]|nr:hypothetical protein [Planctomycetales bacterium]